MNKAQLFSFFLMVMMAFAPALGSAASLNPAATQSEAVELTEKQQKRMDRIQSKIERKMAKMERKAAKKPNALDEKLKQAITYFIIAAVLSAVAGVVVYLGPIGLILALVIGIAAFVVWILALLKLLDWLGDQ